MAFFKGGAGGLFSGAAMGAGIGAIGGPIGAGIGAGVGGLLGATGVLGGGLGEATSGKAEELPAYHVPSEASAAYLQSPEQKQFLDYLQKRIQVEKYGVLPTSSAAQAQLAAESENIRAKTAGAMASARGVYNPALLAREGARMGIEAGQEANRTAAILRAQEEAAQASTMNELELARRNEQYQREKDFLAALELERERKIGFEELKAGVERGNIEAQNRAQEGAKNRQMSFLSGLGQAGATLGSAAITANAMKSGRATGGTTGTTTTSGPDTRPGTWRYEDPRL